MEKKPWYASVTLWSAVIAAAGVFAPKYAPAIGGVATDAATIIRAGRHDYRQTAGHSGSDVHCRQK